MAIDSKYGKVTVEREPGNPLGEDEPVFLIRGRDATAVLAIQLYAAGADNYGSDVGDACRDRAEEIRKWQVDNMHLIKVPD